MSNELTIKPKFKIGDKLFLYGAGYDKNKSELIEIESISINEVNQTFMYEFFGNRWFTYNDFEVVVFLSEEHYQQVLTKRQEEFYKRY